MTKWLVFFLIILIFTVTGCRRKQLRVDVSKIEVTIRIQRLEKDLFSVNPDSLAAKISGLEKTYGLFFRRFAQVINIGEPGTPVFNEYLKMFVTDDINREVYQQVQKIFPELDVLGKKLTWAFKHYKYYFPDRNVPSVYTFVSGFNASLIIDTDILGIGLDRYMGKDTAYYDRMGIPKYVQQKMVKEKIPSDCMYAWAATEFPFQPSDSDTLVTDNVINRMIYEGKLLYFVKAMMPREKDETIMGYTPKQLKWCEMNEAGMWAWLIEHKLLFKTDYMTINKLTRDAPFTGYFSQESPGRAANWIGWQIIKNYMSRHRDVTLPDLMDSYDYREILNRSGYDPG